MTTDKRARVLVRGCELATRESGSGVPFLWAHGLLSNMAQEDAVGLFSWREVGARVVRFDARGHGESAPSQDPAELRWPELARDMLALADTLGPGRVFLGGVSMGCATALHAAVAAPERVAGLVLMAPPTAWATRPRQALFYRVAANLVGWFGLAPFRLLASLPGPRRGSPMGEFQAVMAEQLARADARSVATALRGAAESDLPDPALLRDLRAPALILAWRKDPVHPVSTATRLAELLPAAELHVAETLAEVRAWPERVARFVLDRGPEASSR
jgi:pimeloyl-ACP methyl ester carboxylesterase